MNSFGHAQLRGVLPARLLQTPLPVDAVAAHVGNEDTSNFSRTFRRWVGMTPSEFRAGTTRRVESCGPDVTARSGY